MDAKRDLFRRFAMPSLAMFLFSGAFCGSSRADDGGPIHDQIEVVGKIADLVLTRHIDSPTRQQMLLDATRTALRESGHEAPGDLAVRFSETASRDELLKLIAAVLGDASESDQDNRAMASAMTEGLMKSIPGPVTHIPNKEYLVQQSLTENRYVGIGIALQKLDHYSQITKAFPGGPARINGAQNMDLIVSIDGDSTRDMPLGEVVDRLRGPQGTAVEVGLRQPDAEEVRVVEMIRDVVPIASVEGVSPDDQDEWQFAVGEQGDIGYIRLTSITGSTAQELRQASRRFQRQGLTSVILDLRETQLGTAHHTVMVADALLAGGTIGQIITKDGVIKHEARSESVFRDLPIVCLVDGTTPPNVEWLCAALQDNRRAEIVGTPTLSNGFVLELVEVGDGAGALNFFPTGYYARANGDRMSSLVLVGRRQANTPAEREVWHRLEGGVEPDHEVAKSEENGPDDQIAKAISMLER